MIDESKAYITLSNGVKVQILNEQGDDWDEAATAELASKMSGVGGWFRDKLGLFSEVGISTNDPTG